MCQIFAGQDPTRFRMVTRRVRLSGHSTSVCLEAAFWDTLEEIADMQGVSLGRFLSKLHDEVLARGVERRNFAGLLRCACLTYARNIKGRRPCIEELEREAQTDFSATNFSATNFSAAAASAAQDTSAPASARECEVA